MKDYGIVLGASRPEEKVIDEYSVWVISDITQASGGWEYRMIQYSKEEYIKVLDDTNQKVQADLEYIAMMTEVELD